jgi:hypothetical protein
VSQFTTIIEILLRGSQKSRRKDQPKLAEADVAAAPPGAEQKNASRPLARSRPYTRLPVHSMGKRYDP